MTRTRAELADAEWRATRAEAETVDCPAPPLGCGMPAGQTCINREITRHLGRAVPLDNLPAHPGRIRKAQETP
jgi:hypothetical protein